LEFIASFQLPKSISIQLEIEAVVGVFRILRILSAGFWRHSFDNLSEAILKAIAARQRVPFIFEIAFKTVLL